MDRQTVLTAVKSWPPADRVRLIEEVWDSLADAPEATTLPVAQQDDLQDRLDAYRDDPEAGSPWNEVRARLLGQGQ